MTAPVATYRLQFRNGMDFAGAAALVPYLAELGVSHLYASPLFQAASGSTHGYDVTDHERLDASLGGRAGFELLSAALKRHGLGLILDIVPNHMAATPENRWWRDVLRHGSDSAFAGHFDIDWSQPKLLVPVLGDPYGTVLDAGELSLVAGVDGLMMRYFDHQVPLHPETWSPVLEAIGRDAPESADRQEWAQWLAEGDNRARLAERLAVVSGDRDLIHELHEAQPWQLTYWRAARESLAHRRFFEITDLVGVRVESEPVFDDVHRMLFELIAAGHVDGVRVDHVDGLADPAGYLERLRRKAPRPVPIWIEKILAAEETLPAGWPVEGTTGYEFADAVNGVLTRAGAAETLEQIYGRFTGEEHDHADMLQTAKREIVERNLAAELSTLGHLAEAAAAEDLRARDWGGDSIRRALIAMMAAMPVYRTYLDGATCSPADRAVLDRVVAEATETAELDDPAVIELLAAILVEGDGEAARMLRTRFQQTTGALMAKAVEDTLFYRFNRLISANEVGAEPFALGQGVDEFGARMAQRRRTQPLGLSATATHDTKRGEDARMRIAAIAEAPERWDAGVGRCDGILAQGAGIELDADTRWLFYQALLGAWPESSDPGLADRMVQFMVKAAREAKRHTNWIAVEEDYERRLEATVRGALADRAFLEAFAATADSFIVIGERKGLVQTALKLTLPGVPDLYQGTEFADLSLVDPDNRRPVDFDARGRVLAGDRPQGVSAYSQAKLALIVFGLGLRRACADIFSGEFQPVDVPAAAGGAILAFARTGRTGRLVVVADASGGAALPDAGSIAFGPEIEPDLDAERSYPASPAGGPSRNPVAADLKDCSLSIRFYRSPS